MYSLSYMPMHATLKRKICKKNKTKKKKKIRMLLIWLQACLWRCESYKMYLESDSPHQAIMIVYKCNWFSQISNLHNMRHLCTLAMFHTQHVNSLLLLIYVQVQCDLAITRNTCVDICSLNCLNLFLKYKIG